MNVLLGILTFILVLDAFFMAIVILAQKGQADGGMGAALGGGMAESAFGGNTSSVLTKATINSAIVFFVLSFAIYLCRIHQLKHAPSGEGALPNIGGPAVPGPAAPPKSR